MKRPNRITVTTTLLGGCCLTSAALAGVEDWLTYQNETSSRAIAPGSLFANDTEEKDYAWGDVDNDGDIDLAIVRKTPFTSAGKRANVLMMNEGIAEGHAVNGVLVDRTDEYATASDVPGDQGFKTPTNDRDVVLVDVDLDGWLDLVTAVTLSDNDAKHIKMPRVYMNLGEDGKGNWLGFEYQDDRVEDFTPPSSPGASPRFCSVAAGDLTGDGYPDLYFGDYDSGPSFQLHDFNNIVLVNDGTGHFTDETTTVLPTFEMRNSAFGAASIIADMNNDGVMDVVKQTSLNPPEHIAVNYNNPANEGVMMSYQVVDTLEPYFVSAGDLNNDGNLDLVVVDDFADHYFLHNGVGGGGQVNWGPSTSLSGTNFFGGNSWIADFDKDGFQDIIITDVDVDIPGCNRTTQFLRNNGDLPNVTFDNNPPAGISGFNLRGVHDAGVFDLNGDGWLDLVLGRCSGTEVYIQQPPIGVSFAAVSELPSIVDAGAATPVTFSVEPAGATLVPGSVTLHTSINGGAYTATTMSNVSGSTYEGALPAAECEDSISYYVSAELEDNGTFVYPENAPAAAFGALALDDVEASIDDLEGPVEEWTVDTVVAGPNAIGDWEAVVPNGTFYSGSAAAPGEDHTEDGTVAFVTANGVPGGGAGAADVDNVITSLLSPTVDLTEGDATITTALWVFSETGQTDSLDIEVSDDNGTTWTHVMSVANTNGWEDVSFVVSDYVTPTDSVRVRYTIGDAPNDSFTEAGVDDFRVAIGLCEGDTCPADTNGSGTVDVADLLQVLSDWGACDGCDSDLDDSGTVDVSDLLEVLGAWGSCG